MIRILFVFLVVFALALGGVWLADHPGTVVIRWLGYEIVAPVVFALGTLLAFFVLVLTGNYALTMLFRGAGRVARFFARRREARTRRAIAAGILALDVDDGRTARRAWGNIDRDRRGDLLARLIAAKSADLLGERDLARRGYMALLDDPRGELTGLMGLCDIARTDGDGSGARDYARRAFLVDSGNRKAFRAHFMFLLEDHAWDGARHAVDSAYKQDALTEERARTMTAVLFAAEAGTKLATGRSSAALGAAQKALGLDETCLPAAIVAAEALVTLAKRPKAGEVIEAIWAHNPHPRLGEIYLTLFRGETPMERLQRAQTLAAMNGPHPESGLLVAKAALDAQRFGEARRELERLAAENLTSRVARLFVALERAEAAVDQDAIDQGAVEHWLTIAAEAPRERGWVCQACGHGQPDWAATCPACGRFDTLGWHVAQAVPGLAPPRADEADILNAPGLSGPAPAALAPGSAAVLPTRPSDGSEMDIDPGSERTGPPERPIDVLLRRMNPDDLEADGSIRPTVRGAWDDGDATEGDAAEGDAQEDRRPSRAIPNPSSARHDAEPRRAGMGGRP
ncbi:MAG: heme biosynthesis protein HemY [Alphaproteobacteria bacterium]